MMNSSRFLKASVLVLVLPALGAAQTPVNTRARLRAGAPVPLGVSLDRNPQLGGTGFNYARPSSPLLPGNTIASGLASAGMSFQGFEPIPATTAFQAPLGSAALSAFRRDSVSVASPALGSAPYGQAFYDPSTTVPNVTFLQTLAGVRPVDSGPGSPISLDLRIQSRINPQAGLKDQIIGFQPPAAPAPAQSPLTPVTASLLTSPATASSIFGTETPRVPLAPETAFPWRRTLPPEWSEPPAGENEAQPKPELPGVSQLLSKPLGGALRTQLDQRVNMGLAQNEPLGPERAALVPPPEAVAAATPAASSAVDLQLLPGYEVFTDMRLALALASNPNAPWLEAVRRMLRERPDLAHDLNQQVVQDPGQYLDQMTHAPLRTLAGSGPSALNDQMLKAEAALGIGHYAEAADRYEAAHLIEPANPLPLIGKGHALLAQGNYLSAAATLTQGLAAADHYPGLISAMLSQLDLKALMGGGEVIDMRRADILRRLEQSEDPGLRFLLGYLEYHSGDHAHGLEDLKRAAANPRAGMMIARYPALLGGGTGPSAEPTSGRSEANQTSGPQSVAPRPSEELVIPPRPE